MLFVAGSILRMAYMFATPVSMREHDMPGHLDYVRYIARNWSVPVPHEGLQFHHPPLYYSLAAAYDALVRPLTGFDEEFVLQTLSLFLSIASLLILLILARCLFSRSQDVFLFALVSTVLPGFVFFSSQINNDVLFLLLALSSVSFLLHWWKRQSMPAWIILHVCVGFAFLTKANGALLLVITLLTLAVCRKAVREKAVLAAVGVLIVFLFGGWVYAYRVVQHSAIDSTVIGIGDVAGLTNFVQNDVISLFAFNPVRVVTTPFNDPWGDPVIRSRFQEFFFRSALFGEYAFPAWIAIAASISTCAILLLIPFFLGLVRGIRMDVVALPLFIVLVVLIVGHYTFRILVPFSSSQDFRYTPHVFVPAMFFVVQGIRLLPRFVGNAFHSIMFAFGLLAALFVAGISAGF